METFHRYLPTGLTQLPLGLEVSACGSSRIESGKHYPVGTHPQEYTFQYNNGRTLNCFQLIYITAGRGQFSSAQLGTHQIETGTLIALLPGEWHSYQPDPDCGWDEHWIEFSGTQAATLVAHAGITTETALISIGLHEQLIRIYQLCCQAAQQLYAGHPSVMAALTIELLAQIHALRQDNTAESTPIAEAIRSACCYMNDHITDAIDMEQLAQRFGVGYTWFRRQFKTSTGLSPAQYHIHCRLARARELLSTTEYTVEHIAQMLGFASSHYFSRLFKEKQGITPGAYRQHR